VAHSYDEALNKLKSLIEIVWVYRGNIIEPSKKHIKTKKLL
jgi:hypothetical protein